MKATLLRVTTTIPVPREVLMNEKHVEALQKVFDAAAVMVLEALAGRKFATGERVGYRLQWVGFEVDEKDVPACLGLSRAAMEEIERAPVAKD